MGSTTFTPALIVEQDGPIRWLLLNRPARRNALDDTLLDALERAVKEAKDDDATRVVVLAGNGPSFCAGADLRHLLSLHRDGDNPVRFLTRVSETATAISSSHKPWIAALHGHAVAGGLELALACDLVVAAEDTVISDGHLKNSLLPAAGSSVRLPKAVGRSIARFMLLTGKPVPAAELVDAGWIYAAVPPTHLSDAVRALCGDLIAVAAGPQQRLKALLTTIDGLDDQSALARELSAFADNWRASATDSTLEQFLRTRTSRQT